MAFDFFTPREKFVILEILPTETNGFFLSVDDDRNLIFEKQVTGLDLAKSLGTPSLGIAQKSWEGQYLFKSHRKVIAIASSDVATTIPVPLDLHRESSVAKDVLTLPEFENLIAQAMAKIFNRCRTEAGKRFDAGELEVVLVRAKARSITFDGKAVTDPVGRAGKKISLLLELTFARREVFENLKQFFSSPEEFFFVESPQALLNAFSQVRPLPQNLIVANDDGKTSSLFILENTAIGHPVLYREKIDWHSTAPIQEIMATLDVPQSVAEDLYTTHRGGKVSATVARHFEKMTDAAVQKLLAEVAKAKIKGVIYLDASHALPFDLPYRANGVVFEAAPLDAVMQKLGFTGAIGEWPVPHHVIARHLAPFFEAYFEKDNSEINRKLRRRLHWLAE
jgi:hypothetical protein